MTTSRLERVVSEAIEQGRLYDPAIEDGLTLLEQAQLAQYRRLLRTIRELRDELDPVDPGRVGEVLAYIDEAVTNAPSGRARKVAYIGGLAVVGAAGAVVCVVQIRHRRPAFAS